MSRKPTNRPDKPAQKPAAPPNETQVADFSSKHERHWQQCPECKEEIFVEANGKTYYHRIACRHSNGIRYGKDRDQ